MLKKEEYDLLKAKKAEELSAEEKASIVEYEKEASKNEHMVPKSRLDEEITKRKEIEERLKAIEQAQKDAQEKQLIETNNFKTLYEQQKVENEGLKPKAAIAEESEKVLQAVLESQISQIPEAMRSLVPEGLTTNKKLEWISKNKSILIKPSPFDIGAGTSGGGAPESVSLTAEELAVAQKAGMKPDEYAKYKDK